jgi:tetratricopeptide (TPR) repeat protein
VYISADLISKLCVEVPFGERNIWRRKVIFKPRIILEYAKRHYYSGQYNEALFFLRSAERMHGNQKWLGLLLQSPLNKSLIEQRTLSISETFGEIYRYQGDTLRQLGRYQQALVNFDKALAHKAGYPEALYGKACCHAFLNDMNLTIENLKVAISASPEKYREKAQTEAAFELVRQDEEFQRQISG